jgi:hypothetical protein
MSIREEVAELIYGDWGSSKWDKLLPDEKLIWLKTADQIVPLVEKQYVPAKIPEIPEILDQDSDYAKGVCAGMQLQQVKLFQANPKGLFTVGEKK